MDPDREWLPLFLLLWAGVLPKIVRPADSGQFDSCAP